MMRKYHSSVRAENAPDGMDEMKLPKRLLSLCDSGKDRVWTVTQKDRSSVRTDNASDGMDVMRLSFRLIQECDREVR